jgi:hypothetical protein
VTSDGDLPPGTPRAVRILQTALGLAIIALLASIASSWVAIGSGSRHFRASDLFIGSAVNEMLGRALFGVGAVLIWGFMAVILVMSVKRLRDR